MKLKIILIALGTFINSNARPILSEWRKANFWNQGKVNQAATQQKANPPAPLPQANLQPRAQQENVWPSSGT